MKHCGTGFRIILRWLLASSALALGQAVAAPSPRADLSTFQDCEDACPVMVVIPAGVFDMGTPASEAGRRMSEGPVHRVNIARFAIGRNEVTTAQWARFVRESGHTFKAGDKHCTWDRPAMLKHDTHPATCFDWHDAQAYVSWLSKQTGQRYRLPSEAEWEYAARAGTNSAFHFGAAIRPEFAQYAWNRSYEGSPTAAPPAGMRPVGTFAPNGFGLFDMHGNAWEWVQDCVNENYVGAPADGSAWLTGDCQRRMVRGGSWDQLPVGLRAGSRDSAPANLQWHIGDAGLRVARDLESTDAR